MASDPGGPRPLSINTSAGDELVADGLTANTNRRPSASYASASSTPLSSAPTTPAPAQSNRRSSQPAASPMTQHLYWRPSSALRRTSSSTSLNQRAPSSPGPNKKNGRSEDAGNASTPKRSISNLIAGLREAHSTMEAIEEPIPLTAQQIAQGHFSRELSHHSTPQAQTETVVIVHDDCYGHRYSRLKTTKSLLSMIVERPERLLASVLGVSTAYVRLGEHHAGAKNTPRPDTQAASPPPFKVRRTVRSMDILSPYVTAVHGTSWMAELQTMCGSAGSKLEAGARELSREPDPSAPEKEHLHEGDLYLCSESLNAFQGALGGVADAVDALFDPTSETKHAFVAVRPPGHHCSADYPSGFCWLNNVHVGIEYAAQVYGLTHAAILDFDLHHGDGSQTITWSQNSKNNQKRLNAKPNSKLKLGPDIGYYSIHDINSYPCESGDDEKVQAASLCIEDAHGQSIWNVHLQPWKTEADFWQLYETRYMVLLEKARAFLQRHTARLKAEGKVRPKAAIFISAGFDASEWEGQGMQRHKVNVPTEFYARFTRDVVKLAEESDSACDGKVLSVLEGGYSDRALCSGVLSHLSGLCTTPAVSKGPTDPLALDQLMNGLAINAPSAAATYDKSWWSSENLTQLENRVNPPPPPAPGKKGRTGPQPTYATPTESFAYKVVDTDKFARSISGTMREGAKPTRPVTPPPPEVDWVTATHELSKLLIPSDRQTKSCTAEELGGVRTKKDRQSAAPVMTTAESSQPRQLRDRRSKAPAYPESVSTNSDRPESVQSFNRRQTIGDLPAGPKELQPRRMSRRLSAGSAFGSMSGEIDAGAPPVPAVPAAHSGANGTAVVPAPAQGIPVKKTRVPPSKAAIKPAAVGDNVATSSSTAKRPTIPTGIPRGPAASAAPANQDMDSLTTGMKKVTLKVGTREEHDRKQKEKLDAERRARALKGAETRKANAAAKKAAKENTQPSAAPNGKAGPPLSGQSATVQTVEPAASLAPAALPVLPSQDAATSQPLHAPQSQDVSVLASQFDGAALSDVGPPETAGQNLTGSLPAFEEPRQDLVNPSTPMFQPPQEGGEALVTVQQQSAIANAKDASLPTTDNTSGSSLPSIGVSVPSHQEDVFADRVAAAPQQQPHAFSSPIRPQSRDQLPVWSSTGAIPFGKGVGYQAGRPSTANGTPRAPVDETTKAPPSTEANSRVWDVPPTPHQQ